MDGLPNIVLIIMDTARAKSFSTYGYEKKTTPNIDRIAENSVTYTNCFSPAPWTTPSHVSIFTGLYPFQHGANSFLNPYLQEYFFTLPQILNQVGYKTCAIPCNRLIDESTGFSRGFDIFLRPYFLFDDEETKTIQRLVAKKQKHQQISQLLSLALKKEKIKPVLRAITNYLFHSYVERALVLPSVALKERKIESIFRTISNCDRYHINTTPMTVKAQSLVKRFLQQFKREGCPFFMFINFLQNHTVYNPPKRYRNKFVKDNRAIESNVFPAQIAPRIKYYTGLVPICEDGFNYLQGLYDEELLFLDEVIGNIYAELRTLGLEHNTLFIITSDHGEHIGEKGHFTHFFSVYNELIHVPLIVKYPKGLKSPSIDHRLVQTHDLFATIMDLVQSYQPVPTSSISLLGNSKREIAISQFYYDKEFYFRADPERNMERGLRYDSTTFPYRHSLVAIISSNLWKIIKRSDGHAELYNLNDDFYECIDLYRDLRYHHIREELESKIDQLEELKNWMN